MKRGSVLLTSGIAAVAVVATAVVLWPADEPDKPVARPPAPLLKPLKLADQPAWHGPGGIMDIEDNGDALLFTHGDGQLTLIDGKSGANRWTLEKLHDLGDARGVIQTFQAGPGERHLVDDGVLVEYEYTADCTYPENPPRSRGVCNSGPDDETGVALLSPADGHVVWRTPVIAPFPDVPYAQRPQQILRAADDRVAVVTVTTRLIDPQYDAGTARTVAIDVPTGRILWDKPDGTWPMYIVGDTLLGMKSGEQPGIGPDDPTATVVATNLLTGEKRWERQESGLMTAAGDMVLVRGNGFPILSVLTGKEVTRFGAVSGCATDRHTLIACTTPDDGVVVYDVHSGKTTELDAPPVEAVWDGGRIVVGDHARTWSIDRNGTVIDKDLDLPGETTWHTGHHVLLEPKSHGDDAIEVYAIS